MRHRAPRARSGRREPAQGPVRLGGRVRARRAHGISRRSCSQQWPGPRVLALWPFAASRGSCRAENPRQSMLVMAIYTARTTDHVLTPTRVLLRRKWPERASTVGRAIACPVPDFRLRSAQISIRYFDKFRPNFEKDSSRNDLRAAETKAKRFSKEKRCVHAHRADIPVAETQRQRHADPPPWLRL